MFALARISCVAVCAKGMGIREERMLIIRHCRAKHNPRCIMFFHNSTTHPRGGAARKTQHRFHQIFWQTPRNNPKKKKKKTTENLSMLDLEVVPKARKTRHQHVFHVPKNRYALRYASLLPHARTHAGHSPNAPNTPLSVELLI